MEFKTKNPRDFWIKIASVTKQESSTDIPIPLEELRIYFKSLLDCTESSRNSNNPPCVETDEILDQPIEEEEVRAAIQALKRNKAPGMDGLLPGIFYLLYNSSLQQTY